jgi:hypothetical protein
VACQKPLPTITVFGDGKSVIIDASAYQFSGGPAREASIKTPTLKVQAGSSLLVDVPRTVAAHGWLVTALTVADDGTTTVVQDASSPLITDKHSTRLSTVPIGIGTYLLRITAVRGSADTPTGVWVVQVRTTG